jgi:caffeoyl-CoA O-methyltransferase
MTRKRSIADPALEQYAADHSSPESVYLRAAADSTRDFSPSHRMMVGGLEGRLLAMLVGISGARSVLEIGTFTGYSALAMAEALPAAGHITSLELDARHAAQAQAHIDASPYADRITILVGPALASIARLEGPFDLVFIDADKPGYSAYYEAVLPKLAPRGLICADNVLWSGLVLERDDADADGAAIRAFNDLVADDPRVECVVLTVRDGLTIIRRRD